jgi:hypothetical protein
MAREKSNARSVSLAEPGCGIELDAADIIGGMARSVDHWIPPFAGWSPFRSDGNGVLTRDANRYPVRSKTLQQSALALRFGVSHRCLALSQALTRSPSRFAATVSLASVKPLAAISSTERRMRVASG